MSSLVIEDGEMERGKRTMGKASADGAEIIECGGKLIQFILISAIGGCRTILEKSISHRWKTQLTHINRTWTTHTNAFKSPEAKNYVCLLFFRVRFQTASVMNQSQVCSAPFFACSRRFKVNTYAMFLSTDG
jgi:hypothetical protein